VEPKCLFSGGRGRVCCIEPLLFNQLSSHPMNGYIIIAMATLSKVNLLLVVNHLKIQHFITISCIHKVILILISS
jgi:hypothetical protein